MISSVTETGSHLGHIFDYGEYEWFGFWPGDFFLPGAVRIPLRSASAPAAQIRVYRTDLGGR